MKKSVILTGLVVVIFACGVTAQVPVPPANGAYLAGWGMNPLDWAIAANSWTSGPGVALYSNDPNHPAGAGWFVDWSDPNNPLYIQYAPITFELWIEMYMIQSYEFLNYQWHEIGDRDILHTFEINGTVKSNEGCWILCTADPNWDPEVLTFVGNMGAGDDRNKRDIPVTWRGRWGEGLVKGVNPQGPGLGPECWGNLTWSGGDLILDEVTACNRWFTFEGSFTLQYHDADGYYKLVFAGCPVPSL